jgi:hypothetical protein
MILARNLDKRLTRLRLHVGGIDHAELPAIQTLLQNVVKQIECFLCGSLIIFIV